MRNAFNDFGFRCTFTDKAGTESSMYRATCFGVTYSDDIIEKLRESSLVNLYWVNNVKLSGYDCSEKFVSYVIDSLAQLEDAIYDITVDLSPKSVPSNFYTDKPENVIKISIDPKKMGNIAWFYLGALFRNFGNCPRNIVNFCRIAEMRFGDTTIIKHFGFHNTWMLAHVLKMEENEVGFNSMPHESMYPNYMKKLFNTDMSVWFKHNHPMLETTNYSTNTKGEYRPLSFAYDTGSLSLHNTIVRNPQNPHEVLTYGIWWHEDMPTETLTSLFSERKVA